MTPEENYHQRFGAEAELEHELQHLARDLTIANRDLTIANIALENCVKARNHYAGQLQRLAPSDAPVYHPHTTADQTLEPN